jgi:hypothetical protein
MASFLGGIIFLLAPLAFAATDTDVSRWLSFLGTFHPLILHVPIGVIVAIGGFELWSVVRPPGDLHLRRFLWFIAALTAALSFATGYLMGVGGGHEEALLVPHLWFAGAFTAWCWFSLGVLLLRDTRTLRLAVLLLAMIPMFGAGHFGGLMVHGDPLANAPWRPDPTALQVLPPLGDRIEVYPHLVQPILTAKCQSCHGPGKQNGRLRLDSFERLLAGGETGAAIIARHPTESLMMKSIALPLAAEKHMPPRNRPQLTEAEIALLHWWIEGGASPQAEFAKSAAPAVVQPFLVANYRLLPNPVLLAQQQAEEKRRHEEEGRRRAELEKLLTTTTPGLRKAFFFTSQTAAELNLVSTTSPDEFGDDQLRSLALLLAASRSIDLAGTAITDAGLAAVTFSPTLRELSLKDTRISTDGLQGLATAPQLESLNLFGTTIDARIAETVAGLPSLRHLYVGNTRLGLDDLAALRQRFPKCEIVGALSLAGDVGTTAGPSSSVQTTKP